MALRKTYRSLIYKDLDTYVMVNGTKRLITFRGGSLQPPINGIFVADDPDLIKAMDNDRGNGTSFICVQTSGSPEKAKSEALKAVQTEAPVEKTQIQGIKTLQEAKEFLLVNVEGLKAAQMPNSKSVLNQAAKNGFEFPDLKTE
jgi:hypothetical protein